MDDRVLTAVQALALADVVRAVRASDKVTVGPGGDREHPIAGTLRHLSPASGSAAHFGNGDVRDAWVRITTLQGMETWVRVVELVEALQEGNAALGVAYRY